MWVLLFRLKFANVPKPAFSTCFPADFVRICLGYAKDMLLVCASFTMPSLPALKQLCLVCVCVCVCVFVCVCVCVCECECEYQCVHPSPFRSKILIKNTQVSCLDF